MIKLVLEIWPSKLSVRVERCASLRASQERMIYVPAKLGAVNSESVRNIEQLHPMQRVQK
jgi:hypothetical protein